MSAMLDGYDWNDETEGRLRALWDEGHSTAEIGRRMKTSKNAIVGKVHRLKLPARTSPIKRPALADGRDTPSPAPKRLPVPKVADVVPVQECPSKAKKAKAKPPIAAPAPMIVETPVVPASRITARRIHTCCWPIGHPGTASFCFCEKEAALGKSYCSEHASVAYVGRRAPDVAEGAQAD